MSSIFGKCSAAAPVSENELRRMHDVLNHWHADDSDTWVSGQAGLGCLLLRNTPESVTERQPLCDDARRLCLVADTRIDNRDDLFALLGLHTTADKGMPDSQLLLLLYSRYGRDCVAHLVGDFAFAIWDEAQQRLFCARDQMGVKPFFYYLAPDFLAFATEKKGLLCLDGIDKTIDKEFLCNQLFKQTVQAADATIYQRIRQLPPAHTLTWTRSGAMTLQRYWTPDTGRETRYARREQYYEGLRSHFEEAVRCRLRSAYPVGVELSGGIDSSSITGVASSLLRQAGANVHTFSNCADVAEADAGADERQFMEAVIRFNGISDFAFITRDYWDDPLQEVAYSVNFSDGLDSWRSIWLAPIKAAAMRQGVRSMLSGFPGDEMVTYRGQFSLLDFLDKRQYLKYFTAKTDRRFVKLKPFLHPDIEFVLHKLRNLVVMRDKVSKQIFRFYKLPPAWRFRKGNVVWRDDVYRERFKSYRHYQTYRLLKPQVAMRMETENRLGLNFKMESRYPMADIRLTQYYLSMPNELKYEGEMGRSAFRKAVAPYLPPEVLQRDDKSGNIAPFKSTASKMAAYRELQLRLLHRNPNYFMLRDISIDHLQLHPQLRPLAPDILYWFENFFEML